MVNPQKKQDFCPYCPIQCRHRRRGNRALDSPDYRDLCRCPPFPKRQTLCRGFSSTFPHDGSPKRATTMPKSTHIRNNIALSTLSYLFDYQSAKIIKNRDEVLSELPMVQETVLLFYFDHAFNGFRRKERFRQTLLQITDSQIVNMTQVFRIETIVAQVVH